MTWNLFLDKEKSPPKDEREWIVCRSGSDFIDEFMERGMPSHVSFGGYLGKYSGTCLDIAHIIIDFDSKTHKDEYKIPENFSFEVHDDKNQNKEKIEKVLNEYLNLK